MSDDDKTKQNSETISLLKQRAEATAAQGDSEKGAESVDEDGKETVAPTAHRSHLQIGRRLFHFLNGSAIATLYAVLLTRKQAVYILGTLACVLYLFEQIRINYPELSDKIGWINRALLRAEEQLKESAAVPYAMGILLTILTFPKIVALIAIYTLAIGDPLSALVGIKFGKHRIVPGKTIEGTLAFLTACGVCSFVVLSLALGGPSWQFFGVSLMIGIISSVYETLPLRIDDNLTIPLFTGSTAWVTLALFGMVS